MKCLDLFCGDGGAAIGLSRAFPDAEIVGVDIDDHSKGYPFTFVQADAMTFPLDGYDLIWASPPCQGYSVMRHLPWNSHKTYPLLIAPTLERLRAQPAPFILENVMGARSELPNALWLCGTMFGKRFYRHRLFETNFAWFQPLHPGHAHARSHGRMLGGRASVTSSGTLFSEPLKRGGLAARQQAASDRGDVLAVGHSGKRSGTMVVDDHAPKSMIDAARAEMDLPNMSAKGLSQAIPPAYSEYLA